MSFTSPLFYVVLVPAVTAFYLLAGRWRAIYLLALSYAFYALSSKIYLVLLIVASAAVMPPLTTKASSLKTSRKMGVKRDMISVVSIHTPLWPHSSLTTGVMNISRG